MESIFGELESIYGNDAETARAINVPYRTYKDWRNRNWKNGRKRQSYILDFLKLKLKEANQVLHPPKHESKTA